MEASFSCSLDVGYRKRGTASFRSKTPRFGTGLEYAMHGCRTGENANLAEETRGEWTPCVGGYGDIYRDKKGSYWEMDRRVDAPQGYHPDSLWLSESKRGSVRAMVRGRE